MNRLHFVAFLVIIVAIFLGLYLLAFLTNPHRTCSSFDTQIAAQRWSDSHNRVLDRNKNGVACESLK